jgi:hypothetical protein
MTIDIGQLARETLRQRVAEVRAETATAEELLLCRERFARFLFGWCRTVDEHDPSTAAKPLPRLPYLLHLADALQGSRRIAIEKSRQMMASWIACAFVLWVAMFRPNVRAFIQSKKEEDAADRLSRIYQLYFRLPKAFRDRFPINLNSGRPGQALYTQLYFTWRPEDRDFFGRDVVPEDAATTFEDLVQTNAVRSEIWAIPQGGDIVRQYSVSLLMSDEAAFQEEASEAYSAAAPTLSDDSWYIMISTPNPGFFQSVTCDRELR